MLAPPYSNLCSQGTSSHRQNGALPIAAPDSVPPGIRSRPRSPQSGTRPLKAPSRTAPVIRQRAALGRHSVQDPPGHGMMSRRPSRPAPGSGARDQAAVVLARYAAHRSEEHTSELQSPCNLVCRLLLEKKKKKKKKNTSNTNIPKKQRPCC